MYDLSLSVAWVPAQADMQIDHVAIGELLRVIAAERPQAEALAAGQRMGMVATFQPSVPSMESEFQAMAAAVNPAASISTVCTSEAMTALRAGDAVTHNQLVAAAASQLNDCDAIMLAHFSTAQALEAVRSQATCPVLSSPASAVRHLKALI